jgi:hypothetical protein
MKITRVERGWPGHFICSSDCLFRRNTLVVADHEDGRVERFVVSTVGNYRMRPERKLETIGSNRHYETMIFRAQLTGAYWDMDSTEQVSLSGEWSLKVTRQNRDEIDNLANEMHESNVASLMAAIEAGTLNEVTA